MVFLNCACRKLLAKSLFSLENMRVIRIKVKTEKK